MPWASLNNTHTHMKTSINVFWAARNFQLYILAHLAAKGIL